MSKENFDYKMKAQSINNTEVQNILQGISTWEAPVVASFLTEVKKILAQKTQQKLSEKETNLFLIINKAILNKEEWELYTQLHSKYEDESISDKEQAILDKFVSRIEKHGISRLQALIELAEIKNTSLNQLMLDLGIKNITPDVQKKSNT